MLHLGIDSRFMSSCTAEQFVTILNFSVYQQKVIMKKISKDLFETEKYDVIELAKSKEE